MHRVASSIRPHIARLHVGSVRNARSKAAPGPFTITMVTPESRDAKTIVFDTLQDFHTEFREWRFVDTQTGRAYNGSMLDHSRVNPDVVYEAMHLFFAARQEASLHHQIADKAFEEKSIKAMERHLGVSGGITRFKAKDPSRSDGWHYLTAEKDVVEWDGLWQGIDGRVYCLEVKHFVDLDKIGQIRIKLRKTLEYLNKTPETVIVYVSGKYWSTSRDPMGMARDIGFGVLQENGRDLEVKVPVRGSGLGHGNGGQVEKAMGRD